MSENMIKAEIIIIGLISVACGVIAGCGAIWILSKIIGG